MEWINPDAPVIDQETLLASTEVLTDLADVGEYTSLYDIKLLKEVKESDAYIMTADGKAYVGHTIKCKQTKQKDKIVKSTITIVVSESEPVFQFVATFPDGTAFDARGEYARNNLKIVQKRKYK